MKELIIRGSGFRGDAAHEFSSTPGTPNQRRAHYGDCSSMYFFNLLGVQGVLLGVAAGFALRWILIQLGLPASDSLVAIAMFFGAGVMAVFGLMVDRCDRPGVWQSYRANSLQFIYHAIGSKPRPDIGWNPRRRLAFFMVPLAAVPIAFSVLCMVAMLYSLVSGDGKISTTDLVASVVAVPVTIGLTWGAAVLTAKRRLVAVEIYAASPPPTTFIGKTAVAIDEAMATPARKVPALLILLGAALLVLCMGLHHADEESGLPWIGMFVCPGFIAMGVAGLIDPRILVTFRPQAQSYPRSVRVIGRVALGVGLVAGVCLVMLVRAAPPSQQAQLQRHRQQAAGRQPPAQQPPLAEPQHPKPEHPNHRQRPRHRDRQRMKKQQEIPLTQRSERASPPTLSVLASGPTFGYDVSIATAHALAAQAIAARAIPARAPRFVRQGPPL